MRKKTFFTLALLLCFSVFNSRTYARTVSATFGIGDWFSDSLRTSYIYGGGLLVRPGLDWLECEVTWDRMPAKMGTANPYAAKFADKIFSTWRFGLNFPTRIDFHHLPTEIYSLAQYVVTETDGEISHGGAIGGGLEFEFGNTPLALRFEAFEQLYYLPSSLGKSPFQEDFFFMLKLVGGV